MIKANVLRIKKYNFSVYYQQNFAFRYTPNYRDREREREREREKERDRQREREIAKKHR